MSKLWPGEQLSRHPPKQLFSFQLSASQNIRIGTFAFLRGEPICYCCAGKIKDEYACKHKWSVRYPALPQCVLIPLNAPHLALTCPPPPPLPPATNAATAAITSARCCLYHSFSSQPPLPLFTSSECPPSLLIPRATFYPPIPSQAPFP